MPKYCEILAEKEEVESIKKLSSSSRRAFEKYYHYPFLTVVGWAKLKSILSEYVSKSKLGKHGLRPCGSHGKHSSKSMGSRLRKGEQAATESKPLTVVYKKLKVWLKEERVHGHEVRLQTLTQRAIFELEHEHDSQLVLQEHSSERFFEPTLKACREKLSFLRVIGPSKRQKQWFSRHVLPSISGYTRMPSRLTDKQQ